jgi:hypothetical protein
LIDRIGEGLSKRYDETDFLEDNYPDAIEYNGFDRIGTELIRKRPLDKVGLGEMTMMFALY